MTEMHATAEPAYLDRLALHSNPFSRQNLPGAFFAGRQTSQRINLLLHLLRSSSQIGLIHAPEGYGKSMLLTALQQRGGEDLRFCLLHASPNTSLAQITQHCLQAFGATGDSQMGGDHQQLLRQRLQQLQQIQITPVLLLDDAGQLDNSIQQQLATWLHWQHEGQYLLRAVVTCDRAASIQNLRNERFQDLDLLPLADDEIHGYLQQRLQAAGWQDDLPFTDKQLQRIQRRSKGIPAEINHQAHQQLLGVNKSWQVPSLPAWRIPRWIRWLPLLPVAAGLLLLLIFQQNINHWLSQSRESSDTITEVPAEPELPMVVIEETEITSNSQAEKQNLIELLEELEAGQASPADAPAVQADAPAEPTSTPAGETSLADNPGNLSGATSPDDEAPTVIPPFTPVAEMAAAPDAAEQSTSEQSDTSATLPNNATNGATANSKDSVGDADWIMQQRKTAYTYQLMGSWDRSEIDAFIKKHALNGDVAVFASMRNDQVWYALIYGVYDSKNVAIEARSQWPATLSGISPWLRRFDGVQTQIKEKAPDA